jgi:hypothetical protein
MPIFTPADCKKKGNSPSTESGLGDRGATVVVVLDITMHVAAVAVPTVQEVVPEIVKPESQVGWHLDPLARVLVQLPTAPLVGATDASHEFASHVAAVVIPAVQEVVPETV